MNPSIACSLTPRHFILKYIQNGRNLFIAFQVYTRHRVYEIQRMGLLFFKEQHMNFNTSEYERHL
jgi:hypothetical protein